MPISFTNPSVLWLLLPLLGLLSLPSIERAGRASATAARGGLQTLRRAATTRHWLGTALRGLIGLGLILALSGARWVQSVADLTTVFVLDLSDSVPAEEQERAETFIRQAVAAMPDGDRAAIVAFGEEA
ncbi:MAG: VWA domain-containing protein, partial [Anaerolineales bacterium]|nr:VWA domain-containing protein [Anaerolineales bacterium]